MEVLPLLQKADLVLTDPPYGIKRDKGMGGGGNGIIKRTPMTVRTYDGNWDSKIPTQEVLNMIIQMSRNQIIFGANYFSHLLPQNNHWIVWDKCQTMPSYSDCELIWTSFIANTVKKYTFNNNGMLGDSKDERVHPTQKPTELIGLLLRDYSSVEDVIVDPFAGSCTTGRAAKNLNRKCICIEIEERYCEIGAKRMSQTVMSL
jgi:DNA modification methylase